MIGTGFCGALSTWSTLGYDTVRLAEDRAWTQAAFNIVVSVLAGLGATGLGFAAAGGTG
ncbi:CrcB family protein [Actinomycetospora callitridis]|nr:CrcB family protein [Actinomycetospora callitridis]MDD7919693.1 CrcB family protein [Actinomycetospora callitridis]